MKIEQDKQLHLLVGAVIVAGALPFGLLAAVAMLLLFGIGKEVYDRNGRGTVDAYDAVATILGGAAMLGWLELVRRYL